MDSLYAPCPCSETDADCHDPRALCPACLKHMNLDLATGPRPRWPLHSDRSGKSRCRLAETFVSEAPPFPRAVRVSGPELLHRARPLAQDLERAAKALARGEPIPDTVVPSVAIAAALLRALPTPAGGRPFVPYGPWPCCAHCGLTPHAPGFNGHRLPCDQDDTCTLRMVNEAMASLKRGEEEA